MSTALRLARGGFVVAVLSGILLVVARRARPSLGDSRVSGSSFAAVLLDIAEIALLAVAAWLAIATAVWTIAVVRGPDSPVTRIAARLTPRFWLRVLGATLGGAACLGPVTAHAAHGDSVAPGIVGLRLPDRPHGTATPIPDDVLRPYVVRRGDTLWDIAAARLPARSTVAERAVACHRWYAANQAAIGDDPDLLLPGTTLTPPTERKGTT